jgi:hypothetical protein
VLSNDKTMITEQKDLVSVPPLPMKIGEGPVAWMTAEQGRAIKQWVLEGGSFFAYHNSSHVSLTNKDYRDVEGAVYFLSQISITPTAAPGMRGWRKRLFIVMTRNAQTATSFFDLPPNRVVELGAQIQL